MAYLRKKRYRKVLIKIVGKNNLIVFIENHTNSASKASKLALNHWGNAIVFYPMYGLHHGQRTHDD